MILLGTVNAEIIVALAYLSINHKFTSINQNTKIIFRYVTWSNFFLKILQLLQLEIDTHIFFNLNAEIKDYNVRIFSSANKQDEQNICWLSARLSLF